MNNLSHRSPLPKSIQTDTNKQANLLHRVLWSAETSEASITKLGFQFLFWKALKCSMELTATWCQLPLPLEMMSERLILQVCVLKSKGHWRSDDKRSNNYRWNMTQPYFMNSLCDPWKWFLNRIFKVLFYFLLFHHFDIKCIWRPLYLYDTGIEILSCILIHFFITSISLIITAL